jgi:hypothetical protein
MSTAEPSLLHIPFQRLVQLATKADQAETPILEISPLTGGYVAASVYRLDLRFRSPDSHFENTSFVQKYTHAREVQVMQQFASHFNLEALPTLVDSYVDAENLDQNGASWFISPFYEGNLLTFGDALPASVIQALVTIHAFYAAQPEHMDGLPQLDATFIHSLLQYAVSHLEQNKERLSPSIVEAVQLQFKSAEESGILEKILQKLPVTFIHGDVHPGNIIQTTAGKHILFDWGNVRIAPAMLDLANMGKTGDEPLTSYAKVWAETTGRPLDMDMARLGYEWATAMINLQYLPFAMAHLPPETAADMAHKLERAMDGLRKWL